MTLSPEVIDLVGLNVLDDSNYVRGVREIAVVQPEADVLLVRILVQMIDSISIKGRGTAFDAMNDVAFAQ